MPQLKHQPKRKKATAKDVQKSAVVGNAAFNYFLAHGALPKTTKELAAFVNTST
ncbi:unnamed protein product [Moritella viscosa]|uniref:hypothetical protein n=1 Tax=Moritella viscosa TaxID=80854 RepID=UPI000910AE68|nr:hypothetical protein [Moritella viscosa]SGY90804.1 unnamed protein product [Moritella viscosa]SHO03083.1 unnamed protein product [Moritella viscosa]SHO03168.1 unnamed protein product [Moritella viscosa]SHO03967.1 unnamed protein product [Moritella viscosa]SHO05277.1 unnamed protein product [Moritella viscosa]